MTLTTTTIRSSYIADGTATPRAISFQLRDPADLVVEADGVVQQLGTDYSITGTYPDQAIVPIGTPWPADTAITYRRGTPRLQQYDMPPGVDLRAESVEYEFDRLGMQQQEQDAELARALKVPHGEVAPGLASFMDVPDGALLQKLGAEIVGVPYPQTAVALAVAQAEAAAATAQAITGPIYGSIALGLAGTTSGEEFAVDNGDGTAAIYQNDGGSELARRTIIITPTHPDMAGMIGFMQAEENARAETVQDALRREVWADQYKLDSDTDDRDCIRRAVAAMLARGGGGVVRLSRRTYMLDTPLAFSAVNNVRIIGAGANSSGTILRENFASGDGLTFSNCQACEISGVQFWPAVRKTDGYSVVLNGSCFRCRVDIRTDFGWNGLNINGATETRYSINSRYMLGSEGVRFGGTSTHKSYRAICWDQISDNPFPLPAGSHNAVSFANGMSLSAGDHFIANGAIWQCVSGGTAGGSAPSGYPTGTTPESVFTGTLPSGTATLKWICHESLSHVVQDSYGYSLMLVTAALISGAFGLRQVDSVNSGTSYPIWIFAADLECDHNYLAGIDLERGEGFFDGGNCWVGSCITGNGLNIGANYRGNVSFGSGSRVMGNAQHGILRQAGPVDVRLTGVEATNNSTAAHGNYHGVTLGDGSIDTHIVGGRFGESISVPGNNQGYGIFIGAGCDKTTINSANVRGNATGTINIGSSQTDLLVSNCPGHNPGISTSIPLGSSPFNWTNETGSSVWVAVGGGTVSYVHLNNLLVGTATDGQYIVPPGGELRVTYTGATVLHYQVV